MKLLVLLAASLFIVGCNAQPPWWWWWPRPWPPGIPGIPGIPGVVPRNRAWDPRPSWNRQRWYPQSGDEYAASLGGAPVGFYRKQNNDGYGRRSETTGISLGGARVGLYGKQREYDGYDWDS